MDNDLQIFENAEFGKVRAIDINSEPWFVGKDVALILGYKDTVNALKSHVDVEDAKGWQINTPSRGKQAVKIINESGLYSLILSSKLPTAKSFKRWVTSEVLPTIRKTGTYNIPKNAKIDNVNIEVSVNHTEYNKKIKAEAMLMNARSRMASSWERLVKATSDDTIKKIGISYWGNTLADKKVIPLPVSTGDSERSSHQLSYFCKMVGKQSSWAATLGKKLKRAGLTKTAENGISREDLINGKQIPVFYWYDDVVLPKLKELGMTANM